MIRANRLPYLGTAPDQTSQTLMSQTALVMGWADPLAMGWATNGSALG